uniref:DUF38 domain-containing protein n=1 Tax=Meloidogyne javanica TaxID=6303 RepID=A0A915M4H5_MELJA
MFSSLPTKIFKHLNFQRFYSMKQTNVYCRDFAKCEGELAKGKLHMISLVTFFWVNQGFEDRTDSFTSDPQQLIIPKAKDIDFQLNGKLAEKFKNGFDEPIPLYVTNYDEDEDAAICLEKADKTEEYLLHLPIMIQSKEDIQIAYHYLDKFFKCSFKYSRFDEFIFNPKLIELLFGEAKKFSVQNCHISVVDYTIDHLFKFVLTNLTADVLRFSYGTMFDSVAEKYKDDLFKILLNGNDKFGKVDLSFFCHPKFTLNFYDEFVQIVEHFDFGTNHVKVLITKAGVEV